MSQPEHAPKLEELVADVEPLLVWTYSDGEPCQSATACQVPARWHIEAATLDTHERRACDNHLLGALSELLCPDRTRRA